MTREEIQLIIERDKAIVSYFEDDQTPHTLDEIHWGNLNVSDDFLYFDNIAFLDEEEAHNLEHSYPIDPYNWREATPEEIEKFVKEARQ